MAGSGDTYQKTLDYLRRLCSVREYCKRDIFDKALRRFQIQSADRDPAGPAASARVVADSMVETLVGEGFIDEVRYASAFARDKSSIRGWGPMKIRSALRSKGIPLDIIESALCQVDAAKVDDKLSKALDSKIRQLCGASSSRSSAPENLAKLLSDPSARAKLLRFGLSKGFDYEQINTLISEKLKKNS